MDEKTLSLLVTLGINTDKCIDGVSTALARIANQEKIIRRQKFVNWLLFGLTAVCALNVTELIKVIGKQNIKIQELEAKLVTEDKDEQKGE